MTDYRIPRIHGVSTERSANVNEAPKMPSAYLSISGEMRTKLGYIVTAREQESDERWVLHRDGPSALAEICAALDQAEGDWRVLTLSSPETIYRDLQGTRKVEWLDLVQNPEPRALIKVGRMDLLDPVHDPAIPRGRSHY